MYFPVIIFPGAGRKYSLSSYAKDGSFAMIQGYTIFGLEKSSDMLKPRDDFSKPKIVYQELSQGSRFAMDESGKYFISNTGYLLTGAYLLYLLKILNSNLIEFAFSHYYSTLMGDTGVRWLSQYIMNLPIIKPSKTDLIIVENLTESEIDDFVANAYKLSDAEMQFISSSVK